MKTVLIATHQVSFDLPVSLYCSMGVLTLATALKKRNLPCEVLDLFEHNDLHESNYDEAIDAVVEKILLSKPDVIGFSTMSDNLIIALELAKRIKQARPAVHTILGGPGSAFCAQDILLNFPHTDLVIRGEADDVFPEYIESLNQGQTNNDLRGLVFRNEQKIIDNGWPDPIKDMDSLPISDYNLINGLGIKPGDHRYGGFGVVTIEIGRGCPYSCSFCSTSTYFNREFRVKSTDRIIEEMLLIEKKLGPVRILFNHDTFTVDREYVLELCDKIIKNIPNPDWLCFSRLDTLDKEMYTKMGEAGCTDIFVGLESATKKMQKTLNKKLDVNEFDMLLDIAKNTKIGIVLAFIVGFPEEEKQDIKEMLSFLLKVKYLTRDQSTIIFAALTPMIGTPIYKTWKNKLAYDKYGSRGTTDIPFKWTSFRETIQAYPEIFSVFFHLDTGGAKRLNDVKYQSIVATLDIILNASILIAYEWLEKGVAEALVQHIDEINFPEPTRAGFFDSPALAESIRKVIYTAMQNEPLAQAMFDAVAKYEIAKYEVQLIKNSSHSIVIEVIVDPIPLAEQIENRMGMKKIAENLTVNNQPMHYMVIRDEENQKIKATKVSSDMVKILDSDAKAVET
ncbi:MAG: radical SAM protein [Leptospirales bacterium]